MREGIGRTGLALLLALAAGALAEADAQEAPYFVTYDHQMEEPGSLEVSLNSGYGTQRGGGDFVPMWLELEYGVTGWWTSEVYFDGQTTAGDSTVFTGIRWEHRFRLLMDEHPVNPVLYLELEDTNEADKTIREVVGHDVESDHAVPNAVARAEQTHEVETKLILSGASGAWNVSGNLIAEKNLAGDPWEFGYAFGASRPLAAAARAQACTFCPENLVVGFEMFGGLGDTARFGLQDTSHYLAPVFAWNLPSAVTVRLSPAFGLNRNSHRLLIRVGVSFEGRVRGGA